jgi:hypothetical protein
MVAVRLLMVRFAKEADYSAARRPRIADAAAARQAARFAAEEVRTEGFGRPGTFRAEKARSAPIAAAAQLAGSAYAKHQPPIRTVVAWAVTSHARATERSAQRTRAARFVQLPSEKRPAARSFSL